MSSDADGVTKSDTETDSSPEAKLAAQVADLEARLRSVSAAYRQQSDEIKATTERIERNARLREEVRRGEIVAAIFEPVENLHRAIQPLGPVAPEAAHGLAMVHQQFMTALRGLGLEEVGTEGERFDPNVHEAIHSQPVLHAGQDNTILSVFSVGYRNGKQLIRAARVVIGVYSEERGEG
ncbi:protein GrpE [Deltaproteobacteria bacterium]|nr:protein GrpE [Deltaproteobacteria bacterium]